MFLNYSDCADRASSGTVITAALTSFCLLGLVSFSSAAQDRHVQSKRYRSAEFAFDYPANLKLSVADHRNALRILVPSRSSYWQGLITIRKHNKKTEECDLPQDCQPDPSDRQKIAGMRAHAYSWEDAAMNRYTKTKGYMIETAGFCWDFQLVRTGKPYRKFDLSEKELKKLDAQSDSDSKAANAAFKLILDSFVFLRPQ